MTRFRLPETGDHKLAGTAINRSRKLKFTLSGTEIEGYAGDTVMSAVMASGYLSLGTFDGHDLQIGPESPFYILLNGGAGDEQACRVPAWVCPARDGAEYRLPAPIPKVQRPFWQRKKQTSGLRSLGQIVDGRAVLSDQVGRFSRTESSGYDLVVVGGGAAGLAAARAAARRGLNTCLIERDRELGGVADFYGKVDGEQGPLEAIAALTAELETLDGVRLLTGTDVIQIGESRLVALETRLEEDATLSVVRHIITAPKIVLATGGAERLPLIAGNRSAGVLSARFAWQLARRFGIWYGSDTEFAVATSAAYRLAVQLSDAGVRVSRIMDTRPDPASRHIAFAKAYGIRLSYGRGLSAIRRPQGLDGPLEVESISEMAPANRREQTTTPEALVVSAGTQPALDLWVQSGGRVHWEVDRQILVPLPREGGMAACGEAAGYQSLSACLASGEQAVGTLLGEKGGRIKDKRIDPAFESTDGSWPAFAPVREGEQPGFFESGSVLTLPVETAETGALESVARFLGGAARAERDQLRLESQPMRMMEAAARVVLGEIVPEAIEVIARERVLPETTLAQERLDETPAQQSGAPGGSGLPPYLRGRFGPDAAFYEIAAEDDRRPVPGRLVYANSDARGLDMAIGCVIGPSPGDSPGWTALCDPHRVDEDQPVSIADIGGRVSAIVSRKLGPAADGLPSEPYGDEE
ncbi:FAD-dependent oxidoreductase [Cucumibacter marinus]|uniref:FAD-dependent oxidoreductase n=1 Tax=Cucumibacter marinus TaxID=1121252 RepID=UPI00040CC6D1|nr:FAD-dependent oxidoreductase [Cucumibacter marinus]